MCAKAQFLKILWLSYLVSALSCSGCALPFSHLWVRPETRITEPPKINAEQVWDKSASRETLEIDLPEQPMPFEPEPGVRYKWMVNDDYAFHPEDISARVVARDALLVVEYTGLTAAFIVGFFYGHGCGYSGCSGSWSMPSSPSP
jgi:hypothetical protein